MTEQFVLDDGEGKRAAAPKRKNVCFKTGQALDFFKYARRHLSKARVKRVRCCHPTSILPRQSH